MLVVFGDSGGVGRLVVTQALAAGRQVRAGRGQQRHLSNRCQQDAPASTLK